MVKVQFFSYTTNVLLHLADGSTKLFGSVSQCVNYCNEKGLDPEIIN